jgi:gluconate transporter
MSLSLIAVNLVIALVILLVLILVAKLNATMSIVIASLYMGIACKLGLVTTATTIAGGFGDMMRGIGLPIGFGVMLGQLLSDCGGAYVIAKGITRVFPQKKAFIALLITGAILSIPVFGDVTFVILMPIGIALARQMNMPVAFAGVMIAMGATQTNTFVPPTPAPLTVASLLDFDVGVMILMGVLVTIIALTPSYFIAKSLILSKWYLKDSDFNPNAVLMESSEYENKKLPPFWTSMLPIIIPVLLILLGTATAAVADPVPPIIAFIGDRMVALLIGALCACGLAYKYLPAEDREKSIARAISSCGMILLVTGAGGSFGAVIRSTGLGALLEAILGNTSQAVIPALLITFFIGFIFRISLGSGTAAAITATTIIAPVLASLPIHPVYVALAALAGGMTFPHVNDSGFWVMSNLGGYNVKGGIKLYSIPLFIASIFTFIATLILAIILPMA